MESGNGDYVRLQQSENGGIGGSDSRWSKRKHCSLRCWLRVIIVIIPFLDWEMTTFSTLVLGLILLTAIAVFPSLLLPSFPFILIAGITSGDVFSFVIITAALSVGWLENWPKKAVVVRVAGDGDWFHQFRAIALIRISPFPHVLFNYASVTSDVKYGPYLAGSVVGTLPETFLAIYCGRLFRSLADAAQQDGDFSMQQVINNSILGLVISVATVALTI